MTNNSEKELTNQWRILSRVDVGTFDCLPGFLLKATLLICLTLWHKHSIIRITNKLLSNFTKINILILKKKKIHRQKSTFFFIVHFSIIYIYREKIYIYESLLTHIKINRLLSVFSFTQLNFTPFNRFHSSHHLRDFSSYDVLVKINILYNIHHSSLQIVWDMWTNRE